MLKKSEREVKALILKFKSVAPTGHLAPQVPGSFPLAELLPSHDAKPQVPERQN